MGLLRLMGNKADVVKGLAKRCNENWRVAPTSDIVSAIRTHICALLDTQLGYAHRVSIFRTSKTI